MIILNILAILFNRPIQIYILPLFLPSSEELSNDDGLEVSDSSLLSPSSSWAVSISGAGVSLCGVVGWVSLLTSQHSLRPLDGLLDRLLLPTLRLGSVLGNKLRISAWMKWCLRTSSIETLEVSYSIFFIESVTSLWPGLSVGRSVIISWKGGKYNPCLYRSTCSVIFSIWR